MQRLDSIKFKTSLESVILSKKFNNQFFSKKEITLIGNGLKTISYKAKPEKLGFKQISINDNNVQIQLSAKILREQYPDLINSSTIERVFHEINKTGLITFDIPSAIDASEVLHCDVTKNLQLNEEPHSYIHILNCYNTNPRYNVKYFDSKKNNGVLFEGNQTSFTERFYAYDKYKEIQRKQGGNPELKEILAKNGSLDQFKTTLRMETNILELRNIRKKFNIPDNKLTSILDSNVNVLSKLLQKITANVTPAESLDNYIGSGKPLADLEKIEGRINIINKLGRDIKRIIEFINVTRKQGTNNYRIIQIYKEILLALNQYDNNNPLPTGYNDNIKQIFELLKAE